jgi:hypothetical protein
MLSLQRDWQSRPIVGSNLPGDLFLEDQFPRLVEATFRALKDITFLAAEWQIVLTFLDVRIACAI